MAIGAKLWDEVSKAAGRRICDVTGDAIQEEVTFVGQITGCGRLEGITGRTVGTDHYWERINCENVLNGTANGVLTLGNELIGFKAVGLGKLIKRSPLRPEDLVSLIWFPDPPPAFEWMRTTIVIWEAVVDPARQTVNASAYEWVGTPAGREANG